MKKSDLYVSGSIIGLGSLIIFVLMPFETLIVITLVLIMGASGVTVYKWAKVTIPLYVETNQIMQQNQNQMIQSNQKLLTDSRHKFLSKLQGQINALFLSKQDKQALFKFVLNSEDTLKKLLQSEKIACYLSDIKFGSITITFRLRLKDFSRKNLESLMKLDDLISQALSVDSVRLIQCAGWIDVEVSSPFRVPVNLNALQSVTDGSTVAIGMDSTLQPVTVDISQHGLISAISPSRRGKTTAIKSMLYLLRKSNPDLNIVIVAFKSADWKSFNNVANIILDSDELKQFQTWLIDALYRKAKNPDNEKYVIVFDDLVNLLSMNPELTESIKQCASLGAGVGITTICSTQFTGKSSGGTDIFANSSCRLLFKPSSNLQGARDGGMAGLGLDQLSNQKGDALLVVDGEAIRITTALTDDKLIFGLDGNKPDREWLAISNDSKVPQQSIALQINPMEELIEVLNGWMLEDDVYDFETGKFTNRSEALRRLGWSANGHYRTKLAELEKYIFETNN